MEYKCQTKELNDCQRWWCNSKFGELCQCSFGDLATANMQFRFFKSEIHFASHFWAVLADVGPFLNSRFSNSSARTNSFRKHATAVTAWTWNSLRTIYLLKFYSATVDVVSVAAPARKYEATFYTLAINWSTKQNIYKLNAIAAVSFMLCWAHARVVPRWLQRKRRRQTRLVLFLRTWIMLCQLSQMDHKFRKILKEPNMCGGGAAVVLRWLWLLANKNCNGLSKNGVP